MRAAGDDRRTAASFNPAAGMLFCDSLGAVKSRPELLGYVPVVERAWKQMELDGVLFIDSRPVLYHKASTQKFSTRQRIDLHRLFWNQGVANVLVLSDPATAYIYSGLSEPVPVTSGDTEEKALVEKIRAATYVQNKIQLYHSIATGNYYSEKHEKLFNPDSGVDSYLLNNLGALRDAFASGDEAMDLPTAHAFIGRMLFVCYLLDREIVSLSPTDTPVDVTPSSALAETLEKIPTHTARLDFLYDLFERLKTDFNGTLFDRDLQAERKKLRSAHLRAMMQFLKGHEVRSGQHTLGFWAYDFKMIPVETISAIYENFLEQENEAEKHRSGAFYTPRLLAEMVVDVCTEGRDVRGMRFLDPACGSGIFLVTLFNRLATCWKLDNPDAAYRKQAEALRHILQEQIRGVDKLETACRIACFSLYLAYLDFFNPRDIRSYVKETGRYLPKLLDYANAPGRPAADIPVVRHDDFLSQEQLFAEPFTAVVGNPPWSGRSSKQVERQFVQKVPEYLAENTGVACLLLPSKFLLNEQTSKFQADWLRERNVEKVVLLADYRHILFEHAKHPAVVVRFGNHEPSLESRTEFAAPKFSRSIRRRGAITVRPQDRSWLPLQNILAAADAELAPVEWKRHLWGTPRDQKLLDLLLAMPPLSDIAGSSRDNKRWVKGQGFQPDTMGTSSNPKDPWWPEDHLFLFARSKFWNSGLVLSREDCVHIERRFSKIHRLRDRKLFHPPLVLVSQGFGKIAYCDFPVLFQHSLQSIAGAEEDANLLKFLAVYLRSKLAKYFLFHTAANWGTERDKVHLSELLRIPFPLPGQDFVPAEAHLIIEQVASALNEFQHEMQNELKRGTLLADGRPDDEFYKHRARRTDELQAKLEPLIYQYFGLTDQDVALVEDTIEISIPSSTPTNWDSFVPAQEPIRSSSVGLYGEGLKAYADELTSTLNEWSSYQQSDYLVTASGGVDRNTGLAMVSLEITPTRESYQPVKLTGKLTAILSSFIKKTTEKQNVLEYPRDIIWFDGPRIHIIRPEALINWTRTAALNDAARIYGEIAEMRRQREVASV